MRRNTSFMGFFPPAGEASPGPGRPLRPCARCGPCRRCRGGDDRLARRVARLVEHDAQVGQARADAGPDDRRVLADAGGEDEGIEPVQGGRQGPDRLADAGAVERDGVGAGGVGGLAGEQVPHVAAHGRKPEQPGLLAEHRVELRGAETLGSHEVRDEARVQIPRASAHGDARVGREAHGRVDAPAVAHGGEARARAEVRQDHAPPRRGAVADARELLELVLVGQAVEAVAAHAARLEAPRDG